jgi:hypothetical protein
VWPDNVIAVEFVPAHTEAVVGESVPPTEVGSTVTTVEVLAEHELASVTVTV